MDKSLYFQYAEKYFPLFVTSAVELLNDKNGAATRNYLFRSMLRPTFSADGRWTSLLAKYTRIKADIVALDSELPLKSRASLERISGDLPKLGLKLYLSEKQMKDIDNMLANASIEERTIVGKIFEDVPRVIEAIYEELEDVFYSELSTGVGLSHNNVGQGVRLDMGFYKENIFGAKADWENANADILKDIQQVFDKAKKDRNRITDIYVDDKWLDNFTKNNGVRALFGFQQSFAGASVPVLDEEQAARVILRKWKARLHLVDLSQRSEANGKQTEFIGWKEGGASFVCSDIVGDLVWTTCAEATRPVAGVSYQTADDYILVSEYSQNDPLREFTASQAMVAPVLNNVDKIYLLNSTEQVA